MGSIPTGSDLPSHLVSILEQGPRRHLPPAGAKVCQPCGQLATWDSSDGRAAGHVHGGDFIGFSAGHANCEFSPFPAHLRQRPYRYCEVCRKPIVPRPEARHGLSWLCDGCAVLIDGSGHEPEPVLVDLALRRFARIGGHRPHHGEGPRLDQELDDRELFGTSAVRPPPGWLPEGLYLCVVCGEPRGWTPSPGPGGEVDRRLSRCSCEGPACNSCGRPRSHRPVSHYYDPETGAWMHVPWFAGLKRYCRDCDPGDDAV